MRNYDRIDSYLNALIKDVYPQPTGNDDHPALAKQVIDLWMSRLSGCSSVLDVGCGEGFAQPMFEEWGVKYEGVCLGEDFLVARDKGRNVKNMDFSFLEYEENSFDLVFSRHSLEHSPMPVITLMEWARVSKQWLGIVLPSPEWYTYVGANHYSVLSREQIAPLLERAGWKILWDEVGYKSRETYFDANGDLQQSPPEVHEFWVFAEKKR